MEETKEEQLIGELIATVVADTNPKSILVESDKWDAILSNFHNGEKIKILVYGQD